VQVTAQVKLAKNAASSGKKKQRTEDVRGDRQAASAQKDATIVAFREYYQVVSSECLLHTHHQ
jgi:hypothetical protein